MCAWLGSLWFRRYISIGYGNPFHKMINWHLCVYAWPNDFTVSITMNGMSEKWSGFTLIQSFVYHWLTKCTYQHMDLSVEILQTECGNLWLWLILNKSDQSDCFAHGPVFDLRIKTERKDRTVNLMHLMSTRNLAMSICIISNSWKRFYAVCLLRSVKRSK